MKKHIIIAGVPRAGKSTVSQMIAKRLGYQHVSMDGVIAGIEKTFPETRIVTEAAVDPQTNLEYISSRMAPFLRAMMDSGEYDECDYGMVIDIYQLLPRDYRRYIDSEICDIYYFITSDITPQERFEILKRYDTPKDYTYFHSDEQNYKDCIEIVEISKMIKAQCKACDLPYYETARDRETVLEEYMTNLTSG